MTTLKNEFEQLWKDFTDSYKGALILQSKKQTLSFPLAKLLLEEELLSWTEDYGLKATWLKRLTQERPEKGLMVKDILMNEVKLTEIPATDTNASLWRIGGPVAVGAIGYGAAKLLGAQMLASACAAVIPALMTVPVVDSQLKSRKQKQVNETIEAYSTQLDKYGKSIVSTLLAEL